ncbi:TerB family tellurite resistance protein [Hydrogenophaga sp.]|uniref:TerB family tellurite resistance protein n=1 Tax=Hydrogenophaga sp. TaxID=1904254 RepID=UPI0025BB986D|nr:TerB family tellurite resistance protein [Hydrogenophaga sp.]
MRSYPTDSPEAAARLVAMALVADGHYATAEIRTLDRLRAPARLGLAPESFKLVMDQFCEDLLLASHGEWTGSAAIDSNTRRRLFAEVQDPALGAEVRALCEAVMLCDSHLADGETALLDDMARAWPSTINPLQTTNQMDRLAI